MILDNQKLPTHITGEEGMKIIEAIYKAVRIGGRVLV
jgi:hypothetical protein